jgi:long-chain acyl-CoA synthetase
MQSRDASPPPLDLARLLSGRRLVVIGGTGFLGKVWWTFLLHHYPDVARIHLVVRPRGGQSAAERFDKDVATSACL